MFGKEWKICAAELELLVEKKAIFELKVFVTSQKKEVLCEETSPNQNSIRSEKNQCGRFVVKLLNC